MSNGKVYRVQLGPTSFLSYPTRPSSLLIPQLLPLNLNRICSHFHQLQTNKSHQLPLITSTSCALLRFTSISFVRSVTHPTMNLLVPIILILSVSIALPTRKFTDRDLLLLVKRKFSSFPDPYLDDEYYKPDVDFLRSASQKCVLDRLNLIDTEQLGDMELESFDPIGSFGESQEDVNTLVIFVMYLCIVDYKSFLDHDFSQRISHPRFLVPENYTFCAKNLLINLKKEKPLLEKFTKIRKESSKKCQQVLFDIVEVNKSWDSDFEGCLQLWDDHSLEYDLKFAIMNHEMPVEKIYEAEKKKYGKEAMEVNEKFVDCMIRKLIL